MMGIRPSTRLGWSSSLPLMTDASAPLPVSSARTETDEELLSIPDPNLSGKLIGEIIEEPSDADR